MKFLHKSKLVSALMVSGLFAAPVVQATNGYFAHGYSTKEKGLAGAGVAYSQDALAAATNPAGMAFVGERMDVGIALFSPSDRSYTLTGSPVSGVTPVNANVGEKYISDNDFFLIPHFAYNWQLDNDSAIGVSIYGNGGMNTEYPTSGSTPVPNAGTFYTGTAGVNLEQGFINVSFAKKTGGNHAVGASFIFAAQRFSAQGVEAFGAYSNDASNLSGNRHSTSFGAGFKIGYQGEVGGGLSIGVSYQSRIAMSEFDEYKGLFAEQGGFDVPSTFTLGLAYDLGDADKFVFDVQRINYTDVASISNPIQNLFTCAPPANTCLGGADGGGFGWEDMTVLKLGYEMEVGGNTYRVGYSKADMPIAGGTNPMTSQVLFNILAPAVMEEHVTFGMTMPVGKDQEFNLAVMVAPNTSVKGANPFDGGSTNIELEMEQKEIQVGWAWKY